MSDKAAREYRMDFKLLYCVPGEELLPALRPPYQNFCCARRFRQACQNQALRIETHRAGKRPGCASWSRGPAEAVAVLRPRTRPQTPTVSPPSLGGSSLPWALFWCSVASLSLSLRKSIAHPCSHICKRRQVLCPLRGYPETTLGKTVYLLDS